VRLKAPRGLEQVCPELGELIERLLAEDPFERGNAQQVAEELEALLEYSRLALDEPWVSDASRQPTAKAEPPVTHKPAPTPVPHKPAPTPAPHEPAPPQVRNEGEGTDLGLLYGLAGGLVLGVLSRATLPQDQWSSRSRRASRRRLSSRMQAPHWAMKEWPRSHRAKRLQAPREGSYVRFPIHRVQDKRSPPATTGRRQRSRGAAGCR
jgi:hypothetical protein